MLRGLTLEVTPCHGLVYKSHFLWKKKCSTTTYTSPLTHTETSTGFATTTISTTRHGCRGICFLNNIPLQKTPNCSCHQKSRNVTSSSQPLATSRVPPKHQGPRAESATKILKLTRKPSQPILDAPQTNPDFAICSARCTSKLCPLSHPPPGSRNPHLIGFGNSRQGSSTRRE